MAQKIFDITPPISPRLQVFPGDQPFERRASLSFAKGHHLELSSIQTTVHIGAHADAPSHYAPNGQSIDQRSLAPYVGATQVVRVRGLGAKERVMPKHIRVEIISPRILIDTSSCADPEVWNPNFNSLSPELIDFLAEQGVRLVGIDTPSVDPEDSKELETHQALFKRDMFVLEGLLLKDVPEGRYILAALPLKIVGGEASPVRAILISGVHEFPELT